MFKPLSTTYSKELTTHLHSGQGLSVVKESNFFRLFWNTWVCTSTRGLVLRSFEATGISPLQRNVILQRFAKDTAEAFESSTSSSSVYSGKDWLKIETLLRKIAKDESSKELRKISCSLHHISIQNSLLHHEVSGFREALKTRKKKKKKSKALRLQLKEENYGGAVFYFPHRAERACGYERTKHGEQERDQLEKEKKERDQAKVEKAKEATECRAQRERNKQVCDTVKAVKLPRGCKR
ncbi:hypothetical protein BS50DRAFT_509925 [Corynespora cassiicola Philippines]|uniref:Uncharacterized protein n=1 Tax=Corynespora cassiicola Philippines TaxID=1448308 RepID=A0A2T2MZS8_CORCC|nr:hypothetical protein BS50DRAFT_509925 [Corynespora cassiicola Philippines]